MGSKTAFICFGSLIAVLSFIFVPFLSCFLLPLSHDYVKTAHPVSPHKPPSDVNVTDEQVTSFHEDGFLVIQNALSDKIIKLLRAGSKDIRVNRTIHCEMAFYNGPPIFHKYSHFCMWPDKVHDFFRDALYHSSLAYIASRLMMDQPVRIFSTFTMGSDTDVTIPRRWHADFPVFTGTDRCDNGLVMWMPLEETSYPDANGMVVAHGSNKEHLDVIWNGTWKKF